MSNKENDKVVDTVKDWLVSHGYKEGDPVFTNDKGQVWIYQGCRKRILPPQLTDNFKKVV